ncbi:hypothetical protein SPF06_01015 [Sinomonas sp. JGH33]|uniref:Terminase small subunit n=1 Tax=Sinomonas terricola TaxID=3110330 RepID=A0ABU5T282_9MICC|nr:hypothetical protein [Sinomonas sp. JGH33]MEA5453291.1 hypothetical protein [Sinomonas sp. JGH33]
MADSDTLRKRRYRHHMAGDHGLCIPGRCKALDVPAVDIGPESKAAAELWAALTADGDLTPLMKPLAVEACRIVGRLDRLDRQLDGHDWLRFHANEDQTEVTVYIDKALSEAREQATALKGIVAELVKGLPSSKKPQDKKGGGVLADLAAKRAARGGTPAG